MQMKDREFYISIHICPNCRKNELYGTEKSCPECRAKHCDQMGNWKAANPDARKKECETHKVLYDKRKESGTCTKCGIRKSRTGKTQCEYCAAKSREYMKKYRHSVEYAGG